MNVPGRKKSWNVKTKKIIFLFFYVLIIMAHSFIVTVVVAVIFLKFATAVLCCVCTIVWYPKLR